MQEKMNVPGSFRPKENDEKKLAQLVEGPKIYKEDHTKSYEESKLMDYSLEGFFKEMAKLDPKTLELLAEMICEKDVNYKIRITKNMEYTKNERTYKL